MGQGGEDLGLTPAVKAAASAFLGVRPQDIHHENVQWLLYNVQQATKMFEQAQSTFDNSKVLLDRTDALAKFVASASTREAKILKAAQDELQASLNASVERIEAVALKASERLAQTLEKDINSLIGLATQIGQMHQRALDIQESNRKFESELSARVKAENEIIELRKSEEMGRIRAAEEAAMKRIREAEEKAQKKGFFARLFS